VPTVSRDCELSPLPVDPGDLDGDVILASPFLGQVHEVSTSLPGGEAEDGIEDLHLPDSAVEPVRA
jgi:hypothetical protein